MTETHTTILDGLPFGICIIDTSQRIVAANQFFADKCMDEKIPVSGVGSLTNRNLGELLPADHLSQLTELLKQFGMSLDGSGRRIFGRYVSCNRGDAKRKYRISVTTYWSDHFPSAAHVIIWQYLTDNYAADSSQFADARSRLEVARQLAASLNHEINNPLFVVSATLEDLLAESHDPEQAIRIKAALEAVWRAAAAVKQLQEIRQVVTTDYIEGLLMVDLEASMEYAAPVVK